MEECYSLNSDGKFDISLGFGQVFEKEIADALVGKLTIEVKSESDRWMDTGNVYIEYSSRGKESGILTTKAKYFCISLVRKDKWDIAPMLFLFHTDILKKWINKGMTDKSIPFGVKGGDLDSNGVGTSLGCLVPIKRLHEVAWL